MLHGYIGVFFTLANIMINKGGDIPIKLNVTEVCIYVNLLQEKLSERGGSE